MRTPLVTAAELLALGPDPTVRILDATVFAPGDPRDPAATYLAAHIPGAAFFDVNAIADRDTDLPHMLPAPGTFARGVGALGVGDATHVICYDRYAMMGAARAWWMFSVFGHARVSVLDGGLAAWTAAGGTTEPGPVAHAAQTFTPSLRASLLRGLGDMRALPRGATVLDARSADRFFARAPEPRAGLPSGHIPGSHNLPAASLLAPDGSLLPPDALRDKFAGARQPVTATCGSGVSACVIALAAAVAGLPEVAVYDGSWAEWGSRADTPKVPA